MEGQCRPKEYCRFCIREDSLAVVMRGLRNEKAEYAGIVSKMEKLKGEGKVKTVTYKQLMASRLTYQNMLSLYEIYGLISTDSQ